MMYISPFYIFEHFFERLVLSKGYVRPLYRIKMSYFTRYFNRVIFLIITFFLFCLYWSRIISYHYNKIVCIKYSLQYCTIVLFETNDNLTINKIHNYSKIIFYFIKTYRKLTVKHIYNSGDDWSPKHFYILVSYNVIHTQ